MEFSDVLLEPNEAADVLEGRHQFRQGFIVDAGIKIPLCTSVYIWKNDVELRLGTNITVYSRSISLTYSQSERISTCGHPHPSRGMRSWS